MKSMKFGDMSYGTHFQRHGRKFIKIQNMLSSGRNQTCFTKSDDCVREFNAIDYEGIPAVCPEWLEFTLLLENGEFV